MQIEVLDEFLFADDIAKGSLTEETMHKSVEKVSDSRDSCDLTITMKKTEVAYRPAPGKPYKESTITKIASGRQVHLPWKYIV